MGAISPTEVMRQPEPMSLGTNADKTHYVSYAVVIEADAWPLRRLCPVSIYLAGIAFDLAVFGVPPISQ